MLKYINNSGVPKIIMDWLVNDEYDGYSPNPNVVSATTLLMPPKKSFLSSHVRNSPDIEVEIDVTKQLASKRGTAVHDSIELFARKQIDNCDGFDDINLIVEERHKRTIEVDGEEFIVSAKFDCIQDDVIMDWKNTSVYAHGDLKKYNDWKLQLSICRWACQPILGDLKEHGTIVAFFNQFSQAQADKQAPFNYPEYAVQPYNFELLSYEETEEYIRNRIRERNAIGSVDDANTITCTPEDLWQTGGKYKYFSKPENTRATKVSDDLEELQALVNQKGGIIVEPAPRACEYCLGRATCEQYQGFVDKGLIDADKF